MSIMRGRNLLATLCEPTRHENDLIGLRSQDPPGNLFYLFIIGSLLDQLSHHYCLLMMGNHVPHKSRIISGVAGVRDLDRFLGR